MTTATLIGAIIAGIAVCPLLHWLGRRRGQPGSCPAVAEVPRESEISASQARLQAHVDALPRAGAEGRDRALSTSAGGRPQS